ncbi:hypothetical protein PSRA_1596 [Pseudoscardovia radai]|uniref:Uncharacterized protein n=1 Tax=Pseudoscardovia radai TaxID=987066 RepID=A0A261ESG1_9BIFI|nr:hypothetical protein PSRA_1596 [Pseudoscardovia radai]
MTGTRYILLVFGVLRHFVSRPKPIEHDGIGNVGHRGGVSRWA